MQKGQGGGSEGKGPQGIKGGLLTGGEHGHAGPWGTRDRLPKIRHRGATEAQRDHPGPQGRRGAKAAPVSPRESHKATESRPKLTRTTGTPTHAGTHPPTGVRKHARTLRVSTGNVQKTKTKGAVYKDP